MELVNVDKITKLHNLIVSGNSIIRILNDYEDGLIDKKYITYDNNSFKIKAYNKNKFYLNNKFYAKLSYANKTPFIECIWDYDNFTPSHVVYPIREIKQSTRDHFNIKKYCIKINYDEIKKNIELLESDDENFQHSNTSRKKYTNLIEFYSRFAHILSKDFIESLNKFNDYSNICMSEIDTCYSDDSDYGSLCDYNCENSNIQGFIDVFAFDEMQ